MRRLFLLASLLAVSFSCAQARAQGSTIGLRFAPPKGYVRVKAAPGSFAEYLRDLPLKPPGSPVLLFDGSRKRSEVQAAVIDLPILDRDLIQCADAIIKLRAEYLYARGEYGRISFSLTNGMKVPFSEYAKGRVVKVSGDKTRWVDSGAGPSVSRKRFEAYLAFVYAYAGTLSLSRELQATRPADIEAGEVFIQGGSPGHAVIVADVAQDPRTGKKKMLLVQSYMPSQELHLLKGPSLGSPWYDVEDATLVTPEWVFPRGCLKRFAE
jgi:hypothetical protein